MNIFLDTSVLYKDPFWKSNFYSKLRDLVKEREINLFVSTVVLKELERNYSKIIDEENLKLRSVIRNADHYEFSIEGFKEIDKERSVKKLQDFYQGLEEKELLISLNYENDLLPEIVDRAIWRKKPFSENKTELKDTIIWLTYTKYAEEKKLEDCIFLTENVHDFCNNEKMKSDVFEIHPDLQKDSNRFKIYKNPKHLIESEKDKLQFASPRFTAWLQSQKFDSNFLRKIIEENYSQQIEQAIERKYEDSEISKIFKEDHFMIGYLVFHSFDFEEIRNEDIEVNSFDDECLISADMYVHCSVEGYEYQPSDPGEGKYKYVGDRRLTVRVIFSFFYGREEKPRQFDIDLIETAKLL